MMQPLLPPTPVDPPTPQDYLHLYTAYRKEVHFDKTVFPCPYNNCQRTDLLPKDYEAHCIYKHGIDTRYYCAWCRGAVLFTEGHKQKNILHLMACWRQFLAFCRPTAIRLRRNCPSAILEHLWDLPDHAYDVVWPAPLRIPPLTFRNVAINPAVAAVRLFLESTTYNLISSSSSSHYHTNLVPTTTKLQWFHVTVALTALTRFLKAMDKYDGRYRTLPHSCWCMLWHVNLRHRHWIVTAPAGDNTFLNTITNPMFRHVQTTRITNAFDLVNTLGDLSGQRRGSGHNQCPTTGMVVKAYYPMEPLPEGYRLPLLMQWDNGLLEDELYRIQTLDNIKLLGLRLKASFCVSDYFKKTLKPTEYWLHFIRGEKLYFKHHTNCDNDNDKKEHGRGREIVEPATAIVIAPPKPSPASSSSRIIETIILD